MENETTLYEIKHLLLELRAELQYLNDRQFMEHEMLMLLLDAGDDPSPAHNEHLAKWGRLRQTRQELHHKTRRLLDAPHD
ncbi:MAG: hypothetical protein OXU67_03420 [Chloroflexota bacterium]|nr:hypothetical protein [Chloroflexota bacterium]